MSDGAVSAVPFREALRAWIRIALLSFGGPAGQISVVHRIVVDEKRWVSEPRFLHALSYCMLLPGPEAQQLVTYIGWLLHGTRGALVAGSLFVLPGFLAILALSVLYTSFGDTTLVAGIFQGLKPAVFAVVIEAVVRLRRKALRTATSVLIAAAAFVAIFLLHVPFPLIIAAAALLGWLAHLQGGTPELVAAGDSEPDRSARPSAWALVRTTALWLAIWLVPVAALLLTLGPGHVLVREGVFFSKVALVTFGGAYSVLTYVAQQAVDVYAWVTPAEMLDGLGLAESTPGPLIMVVQFVGFLGAARHAAGMDPLVAGVAGSVITTWVTFAPCFLFILAGAPYVEYLRGNRALSSALAGIMAAVVGVVLNLAVWFGLHTFFSELAPVRLGPLHLLRPGLAGVDWIALLIAACALLALMRYKVGMMPVLGAAALVGAALSLLG